MLVSQQHNAGCGVAQQQAACALQLQQHVVVRVQLLLVVGLVVKVAVVGEW